MRLPNLAWEHRHFSSNYNMAHLLASQQKNEEALAFYRKALELEPTDTDAKHNYEMIRYQQQQEQQQQQQQNQNQEDQEKQDQQQDQQNQEKQEQDQQEQQQQQEQQEQQSQEQQQQANEEQEKQQDLQHAQAILDALKKDEKVNQKRQMAKARSKKLEKDW